MQKRKDYIIYYIIVLLKRIKTEPHSNFLQSCTVSAGECPAKENTQQNPLQTDAAKLAVETK